MDEIGGVRKNPPKRRDKEEVVKNKGKMISVGGLGALRDPKVRERILGPDAPPPPLPPPTPPQATTARTPNTVPPVAKTITRTLTQPVKKEGGNVNNLIHPRDTKEMVAVMNLAILPPMKVDNQDNPKFTLAREALRKAIGAVDERDLGRKINTFVQRTISGTASPQETDAMFGLYTAQGRRWQAHDVLAVKRVITAVKTSRPALLGLFTETFVVQTREGPQNRNLAHQVPNTNYVSYAYNKESLPAYLKVLKANNLTDAAKELENYIGESNLRAVMAQQRAQQRKAADAAAKAATVVAVPTETETEKAEPPAEEVVKQVKTGTRNTRTKKAAK